MKKQYLHIPLCLLVIALLGVSAPSLHAQKGKSKPKGKGETETPEGQDPGKTLKKIEWFYMEACTQLLQENEDDALKLFESVLELDPKHHATHYNIARIQLGKGNTDQALQHIKEAVAGDAQNYWYMELMRDVYEKRLDWKSALTTQETIVRTFPAESDALNDLARLYIQNERPQDALTAWGKLEALKGFDEETVIRKFDLCITLGLADAALAEVDKLVKHRPAELRFLEMKYDLLQELGRKEEAGKLLSQMQTLDPNNGFLLLTLADHYKSTGDIKASDEYLFRAMKSASLDLQSKLQILTGLLPRMKEGAEIRTRILSLAGIIAANYPAEAQAQGICGDVMRTDGKRDSALIFYRKSLALEPSNRAGWQQLLSLENEMGNYANLKSDGEKALEYFPNEPMFLMLFGNGCAETGDLDGGIYAFDKLRKMSASRPEFLVQSQTRLGDLYHKKGNYPKSDEAYSAALLADPNNALVKNNFAYHLAERKERLDDAERMSREANEATPGAASFQDTYGFVLYQKGDYANAVIWLQRAANGGGGPESMEHYADALLKTGDTGRAREYYEKAIAAGGDKARLDQKLHAIQ